MTVCSNGPQKMNFVAKMLVFPNASVQSSGKQSVVIKNSAGKIVSQGSGASSSGGSYTVIKMSPPTFFSDGGDYTIELSPQFKSGIISTENSAHHNGRVVWTNYAFGGNDGGCKAGDQDFNDVFVLVTGTLPG